MPKKRSITESITESHISIAPGFAGSGKSFLDASFLAERDKGQVIIIDKGNSYWTLKSIFEKAERGKQESKH